MERNRFLAIVAVVIGASAFGFLGLFTRYFMETRGLGALDTVMIRVMISVIILLPILLVFDRSALRISWKDVPVFLLFGLFKFLSDVTLFYSQSKVTLCLATLLQMTAPFYVMFISMALFKEKLTLKKMVALTLSTAGCIMVTGALSGNLSAEITGVISAMLSGLFFGVFMIGGRVTYLRGIKPEAGLFYTFLVSAIFALPFVDISGVGGAMMDLEGLFYALMLGLAMSLVPFYLYTWSAQHLEPTATTMISVLEVVVAAMVGFAFFGEDLSLLNIGGMTLVILSIILMNLTIRRGYRKKYGKYVPPAQRNADSK